MSQQRPPVRGVRWSEDGQCFELRCTDCLDGRYWPLTLEFWAPGQLQRCRACEKARAARNIAERRKNDPVWYEKQKAEIREYKRLKARLHSRNYRERQKAQRAA